MIIVGDVEAQTTTEPGTDNDHREMGPSHPKGDGVDSSRGSPQSQRIHERAVLSVRTK